MRNSLIVVVVLLTLAFALVACGGSEQPAAPAEQSAPDPTEATGGSESAAGDPENGEQLFVQNCSACHGQDATGLENLGKDLTSNEFIQGLNDEELLAFVKEGRPASHPDNTQGIDMPPKGGNPALTDEQILDIIAYLRTLQ